MSQATNKAVYWGTGRRKSAIARVRLVPGNGELKVNQGPGDVYLQYQDRLISRVKEPLAALGLEEAYDIHVNAHGG
ncbi:MAG: 30S ribosomal protein S9, partial [Cyanobacteria bacterium J06648_11]